MLGVVALLPVDLLYGQADLWAAYGAACALCAAGVWTCVGKARCRVGVCDGLLALWLLYVVGHGALSSLYPCGFMMMRVVVLSGWYVALRLWLAQVPKGRLWLTALLVGIALCEACMGVAQMVEGVSRHEGQLMTGSFLNSGPFAICLMTGLVLGMGLLAEVRCMATGGMGASVLARWGKNACTVALLLMALCLALATSRAALVGWAVGAALVWRRWLCRRHAWWLLPGAGVMALLLWLKAGSAMGRVGMALVAGQAMSGRPWTGWGLASFAHRYAEQMASMSAALPEGVVQSMDVPEYAFNTLLQIGVEQGLAGCLLAVLLVAWLSLRAWRGSVLAAASVALCVTSLFSYPFSVWPLQLMFVAMVACVASEKTGKVKMTEMAGMKEKDKMKTEMDGMKMESNKMKTEMGGMKTESDKMKMERGEMNNVSCSSRLGRLCICLVALLAVVWCLPHIDRRVEAERQYALMRGAWGQSCLRLYDQLMSQLLSDPHFLFSYAKALQRAQRYNDSNAALRRGTLVSADPMFYVLMGNNEALMGACAQAEAHYRKAYALLPNRLYPLYRLMLLYRDRGEWEKMRATAHRVMAFKEKRPSAAVREMKCEARWLLMSNGPRTSPE